MNFDDVVRTQWQPIFRFMMRSVRDWHVAEDLTQECFSKAYKGWPAFRGDCSVYTWLRRIATNVIRDFLHDRAIEFWRHTSPVDAVTAQELPADNHPSAEVSVVLKDRLRLVWRAAMLVSPRQQTAFVLRFSQDMDVPEIASAMGITDGAAKVHLFRAVQKIRRRLAVNLSLSHRNAKEFSCRLASRCDR